MELIQELLAISAADERRLIIEATTLEKGAEKVGISPASAKHWSEKWKRFARKSSGVNSLSAFADFKDSELHVNVNGKRQKVSPEKQAELAKAFKLIKLIYLTGDAKVQEDFGGSIPPLPRLDSGKAEHRKRLDKMSAQDLHDKIKSDLVDERGYSDVSADDIKGHAERTAKRLGHDDVSVYWNKIKHLVS